MLDVCRVGERMQERAGEAREHSGSSREGAAGRACSTLERGESPLL